MTAQPAINVGLKEADRKAIANSLSRVLADSYMLYLKTHNYHWNVTGQLFNSLHAMFEEQYSELATAIDVIAERIRALGEFAPGSFAAYAKLTSIKEEESVPDALTMVRNLVGSQEMVVRTVREAVPKAAAANDEATVDLLTQRLQIHEKTAWMLRSML